MKSIAGLILCVFVLTGCVAEMGNAQPGDPDGAISIEHNHNDMMVLGEFDGPPGSPYHPAHPDHLQAAARAFAEADALSDPAIKLLNEGAPVTEIEPLAREAFANADGISEYARWALVADLAGKMLRAHLREPEPNTEAVAYYTQLLLDQDSPNAIVLAKALDHLEGEWTDVRVAESRLSTADAVIAGRKGSASASSPMGGLQGENEAAARSMRQQARLAMGQ
jgi:hypothetical protein